MQQGYPTSHHVPASLCYCSSLLISAMDSTRSEKSLHRLWRCSRNDQVALLRRRESCSMRWPVWLLTLLTPAAYIILQVSLLTDDRKRDACQRLLERKYYTDLSNARKTCPRSINDSDELDVSYRSRGQKPSCCGPNGHFPAAMSSPSYS
ncbi:hypothetical protein EDD36DRAFT_225697 [Exophiala viscosa]|uniref:Uncharacterized protein n=1 Tax=Exophiala viscosa TaxID=2486360 RepID=A0AAN6DXE3_9EURO|nr:hypothetical protein EDD36DRAFT_225697 [Exophiala viscosa]